MEQPAILFSLFYWLCAFLFVVGPAEFKSAGITIENFFSGYIGSEDIDLINFHVKRTAVTVVYHSLLPFAYFLGMTLVNGSGVTIGEIFNLSIGWHVYSSISILIIIAALTTVYYWQMNDWSNHPIIKDLMFYVDRGDGTTSWRVRASEIGNEFRRIDKYTTSHVGWSRVIVTENWIIVTSLYKINIARQDKVTLAIMQSEEHDISPEFNSMVQYLHLRIKPTIRRELRPFHARILSTEFKEFKDATRTTIVTLPSVKILQSVDEMFLKAFREQVGKNEVYHMVAEAEQCIGCMHNTAEVKLVKNCATSGDDGCVNCYCRPSWCIDCMGRWYASRQNRTRPDTWLSGNATCPMCRMRFCMLDISLLQTD